MDNDNFNGALPRLVERAQIEFAVSYLVGRGVEPDTIPENLARHYHVCMDTLNDVLADANVAALAAANDDHLAEAA
jgi:hypothetical protein